MSDFSSPETQSPALRRSGVTSCSDSLTCAFSAQVTGDRQRRPLGWWLTLLLLVCCTLTPWLQQLHTTEHLVTPVDELRCHICHQGSQSDLLTPLPLMVTPSQRLSLLLVVGLTLPLLFRRFTAFSSRAPPLAS